MDIRALMITLTLGLLTASVFAEPIESQQQLQLASATEDLELLEKEIRQLNVNLQILEEDLLYPASSRVAVYLSMDVGELFQLEAVTLKLNGDDVAHHLYTERQVNALYKGGVQELYLGNAKQGNNTLTAFFTGKGPNERDYKRATTIDFEQSFEPVFVELSVTDQTRTRQPEFSATIH